MTTIPEYPWFDQAPENYKTRRQLAELGLRPGGPVVARVVWKRGERWADLFDVAAAKPKKAPTAAQLAALEKAQAARQICPYCKVDVGFVIPYRWRERDCWSCVALQRKGELAEVAERARQALANPATAILDSETTGLDGYLVQLAVIDRNGAPLLNTLVRPNAPIGDGARAIHHISDELLVAAPTFADIEPKLREALAGREVWIYNEAFDTGVLYRELHRLYEMHWPEYTARDRQVQAWFKGFGTHCAMELYAEYVGDWSDYHGSFKRKPLPGGNHSALGDCQATLAVLKRMAEAGKESEDGADRG